MSADQTITPIDLRDFLKSQGWSVFEQALADRLFVFSNPAFARRQLVFPMDLTAPDYTETVDLVLGKISELMEISRGSLMARLLAIRDDVLRIRVFNGANSYDVPLSFASSLITNAEKLLKAAACTVLRPRAHHPRLALSEANQLIEKSRFGQTERGSYVVKVSCPLNALEVQGCLELNDSDAPFVRQVTLSLNQALQQLTSAIEADSIDSLVQSIRTSVSPLVSSNLCEALSGMHDDQMDNSLDLSFDWSVLRHLPPQTRIQPIRIQRDYFARVEEIRRELRSVEREQQDSFIGTVERLDGEMGDDGRRSGVVVLAILLAEEGESVRTRTVLTPEQYAIADEAHMTNGAYVRVTGKLRPGRQPRQLTGITDFSIVRN
ncbi:MAG: hypothetical protein ACTS8S_09730 [Giesbergeria sp.]